MLRRLFVVVGCARIMGEVSIAFWRELVGEDDRQRQGDFLEGVL